MAFAEFGLDPFTELRRMQNEMNRVFRGLGTAVVPDYPPVNLWMGENSVVATAELPGIGSDDIDLTIQDDVLTIRGKPKEKVGEKAVYHRRERNHAGFSRSVRLPYRVDPDKVQARCHNGILEIELERPESERPRKIRIQTA